MSIQVRTIKQRKTGPLRAVQRATTILVLLSAAPVFAADSYQQRMLFSPTDSILRAEAKGRVMIYDGMDRSSVDKAMNEQFDRIDNMMFIRIRDQHDDGEYYEEDDGCD